MLCKPKTSLIYKNPNVNTCKIKLPGKKPATGAANTQIVIVVARWRQQVLFK